VAATDWGRSLETIEISDNVACPGFNVFAVGLEEVPNRDDFITQILARLRARKFYRYVANSKYLQNAFASCIWRGVRHSGSNKRGDATTTHMHFAREVATFRRFAL
jgi:hypothetical protein